MNISEFEIDLTPTFREATAISLAVIEAYAAHENPSKELRQAYEDSRAELMKYADELDRLKSKQEGN